jgi:predicted nucleic acid-binding protein
VNVVIDTSVVLRVLFGSAGRLEQWGEWEHAYASELVELEGYRRLSNARLEGLYDDDTIGPPTAGLRELVDGLTVVELTDSIKARARGAFPAVVRTLDALHLSTALALVDIGVEELVFATHDERQGRAARALGLSVIGLADSP